jgi:hypothetical protein
MNFLTLKKIESLRIFTAIPAGTHSAKVPNHENKLPDISSEVQFNPRDDCAQKTSENSTNENVVNNYRSIVYFPSGMAVFKRFLSCNKTYFNIKY